MGSRVVGAAAVGAVALGVALLAGCGGGGARPEAISAGAAAGETFACTPEKLKGDLTPFTVDWSDGERTALESTMRKGVAVVAMTCEGPKVLRACRVTGDYRYHGVSRKSKVVQMKDLLSVVANFGGALANPSLAGELKQGRSLNMAYVLVGNHATAVSEVSPAHLIGRCEGATHFVYEAQLGAFAVETSELGKIAASVTSLFGSAQASDESSKSTRTTDGDVAACEGSSRDDRAPVDGCSALMRLELMAIREGASVGPGGGAGGEAAAAGGATSEAILGLRGAASRTVLGCPDGFTFVDGVCAAPEAAKATLCAYTDEADCQAQCAAGSAESCDRWAYLKLKGWDALRHPRGVFVEAMQYTVPPAKLDAERALWYRDIEGWAGAIAAGDLARFEAACGEGLAAACGVVGVAAYSRVAARVEGSIEPDAALVEGLRAPLLRACSGGEVYSCMVVYHSNFKVFPDEQRIAAFEGACGSGDAELCGVLASLYAEDVSHWGEPDDIGERSIIPAVAEANAQKYLNYMVRACTGGVFDVCPLAAAQLIDDRETCARMKLGGILRPKGFNHYPKEQIGDLNDSECSVDRNPFLAEDKPRAAELLKAGCTGGHALSCEKLKTFFPAVR